VSNVPFASVVIPTHNGGQRLLDVLDAVLRQHTPWAYEVIVIDSESDDGTTDAVQSLLADSGRGRWVAIRKSEFGHGTTRNLGVETALGEYVAFLTQDALPCDETWLASLVSAASSTEKTAGAFGRHRAVPESSCITQQRIARHFDRYTGTPLLRIEDSDRYRTDLRSRQFLNFYSDNNSCLKKDVWRMIPYPDVAFAEDQAWAKLVLEAGYTIAYADDACVHHSHEYDIRSEFQRSAEEAFYFETYFGHGVCASVLLATAMAAWWTVQDLLCVLRCDRSLRGIGLAAQSPIQNLCRAAGYWRGSRRFRREGGRRALVGRGPGCGVTENAANG